MEIIGVVPGKTRNWSDLVAYVLKSPLKARLLKTSHQSGYLTDGALLTAMSYEERLELDRLHWDVCSLVSEYQLVEPFIIKTTLPKFVGPRATQACHAGGTEKRHIVSLESPCGRKVFVEAKAFLALNARHPMARWLLANSNDYWQRSVVLLEDLVEAGLFASGQSRSRFLGAVATIPVEPEKEPVPNDNPILQRHFKPYSCYYSPMKETM